MANDFRLGEWLVQPGQNCVSRGGASVHLEPKIMEVLLCLAGQPGATVAKEELLRTVWPDTFVTDDGLTRSISELRRVFQDDAREPHVIQTIPKRGYRLVATVVPTNGVADSSPQLAEAGVVVTGKAGTDTHRVWMWAAGISAAVLLSVLVISLWSRLRGSVTAPQIHSLAVLPLQNLSADPAQEYFSDGMTDALITDLAQIGSLKVISRTSVVHYKKTEKALPEIARELGVDGIVEGTVQRDGNRVRITAQLIHAPSDKHLWAKSYERDFVDVLALEENVADDIANQVQARLRMTNQMPPLQPRLVKPEVLEAYIQGNYHLQGRGRGGGDEEENKAAELFQHAIDLDPNFAPAYIGLARSYESLSQGEPGNLRWRTAAEKAVALDPSSDAILVLGEAKRQAWDWNGAEESYRRAIALNPNNAAAHDLLGGLLDDLGQFEEGWKEFEIAQQLDPNQDHLADPLYNRGQFDRAIEIRQRIALRDPGDGYNHYSLAMNYAQKRMFKEFTEEMGQATKLFGMPEVSSRLRHAYDQSGGNGVLREWARELETFAAGKKIYLPGNIAELYAVLGDKDRAFYWLDEYRQHHDIATAETTCCFTTNPWLAPIRSDARFTGFLRRIGLPP